MVPFIDLTRNKINPDFATIIASRSFIGGGIISDLESALCGKLGAKHCVSCGNGTDALQLALRANGIGAGDLVIVPEYTFWATAEAVVNVGATPITVDIGPDKCLDYDLFEQAVNKFNPAAVILVHILGWCSESLHTFREFCLNRGIILIEDGAQAFGVEHNGDSIFKDARCITTSFYPAKVFGGCGDGGAVFTNSEEIASAIRSLGNHGRTDHYSHAAFGWNSRLDTLNAAYLLERLIGIDKELAARKSALIRYRKGLGENANTQCLAPPQNVSENGYLFTIQFQSSTERDRVKAALRSHEIASVITYPTPISLQPGFMDAGYPRFSAPENSLLFGKTLLNLPLFPGITHDEQDAVIDVITRETK